jgi:hypothetical protein
MKRPIARLAVPVVLALLLTLCLLTVAGPALAADNPSLWGAHQFNSRSVSFGDGPGGSAAALLVSNDPWASGTLLIWWDGEHNGHWSLSSPAGTGTWAGTWVGVPSAAQTRVTITGTGSGDYAGYRIEIIGHTASGRSPLILKGSYWLTD